MKKNVFLILLAVIMLSSCNKNSIFDGSDKSAILPVEASTVLGSDNKDFFNSSAFRVMGSEVLNNFIKENGLDTKVNDCAIVINDSHLLGQSIDINGIIYDWPHIDFSKYSLVIGRFYVPDTGYILIDHRAKTELSKTEIFLHIMKTDGGFTVPWTITFGALYPKLPSGPAKVTRWDDDTIYHVEYPQ